MNKPKLQFSGLYKSAEEIHPKQLIDYYFKGDQAERREAGNEILRRLEALVTKGKQEELAMKAFIASCLHLHEKPYGHYYIKWTCPSEEQQKEWLDKATTLLEAWRKEKIEMKKEARENLRPIGLIQKYRNRL